MPATPDRPAQVPAATRADHPGARLRGWRLALVLVAAVLPLLGLAVVGAEAQRQRALDWAGAELADIAAEAARRQAAALGRVRHWVAEADAPAGDLCAALVYGVVGSEVDFVAVRDREGREVCRESSGGAERVVPGLGSGIAFAAGQGPGLTAAWPLPRGGSIAVGLVEAPRGGPAMWQGVLRYVVVDPDDCAVLAAWPEGEAGLTIDSPRLLRAMRTERAGGAVVSRGAEGSPAVFGYAPIQVGGGQAVMAVGVSQAVLLAEADGRRDGLVVLAGLMAVAGVAAGWALAAWLAVRRRGAGGLPLGAPGTAWVRHHADLAVALDFTGEMILRLDGACRVQFASPAARGVLGYAPNEVIGANLAGESEWDGCRAMLGGLAREGGRGGCQFAARRKDDSEVWLAVRAARLADGGFVLACRDIGRDREVQRQLDSARARLAELSHEDLPTGLANRNGFDVALAREIRRARRVQEPLAVVLLVLRTAPGGPGALRDLGRAVAGVLRRPGDLAARLGEAEFALLLPTTDRIGVGQVAARLRDAMPRSSAAFDIGACSVLPLDPGVAAQDVERMARSALGEAGTEGGTPAVVRDGVGVA